MNIIDDKNKQILFYIYRGLLICLILLGLIILTVTVCTWFFSAVSSNKATVEKVITHSATESSGGQTFMGIGQIRVPTAEPQPGMVIIFVSFIYYPEDRNFSEELVLRVKDFREIISNYFSSFSIVELQEQDEDTLKKDLLNLLNSVLRLGKIDTLFFNDFMVIG